MPGSFIFSVAVFVAFTILLFVLELRYRKKAKKELEDIEEVVKPGAKVADKLYRKKYGRPSTELTTTFPDLKEAKDSGK